MNDIILKRVGALMSVKSLVTLILTGVIIPFYFGTQSQKVQDVMDKQDGDGV